MGGGRKREKREECSRSCESACFPVAKNLDIQVRPPRVGGLRKKKGKKEGREVKDRIWFDAEHTCVIAKVIDFCLAA